MWYFLLLERMQFTGKIRGEIISLHYLHSACMCASDLYQNCSDVKPSIKLEVSPADSNSSSMMPVSCSWVPLCIHTSKSSVRIAAAGPDRNIIMFLRGQ